jgi:hypothetical protein
MKIPDKASKVIDKVVNGGFASKLFGMFMGRFTFFACVYSVVGLYGWLMKNRDLTSFALFVGAIQALLLAHSYKEDYAAQNAVNNAANTTTVVNDITVQK